MFFLVHRRYNEAHYCIYMYKNLTEEKFSIEKLAFLFSRIFSIRRVYKILRKYYWFEKKIKKITLNFKIDPSRILRNLIQTAILAIDENNNTK